MPRCRVSWFPHGVLLALAVGLGGAGGSSGTGGTQGKGGGGGAAGRGTGGAGASDGGAMDGARPDGSAEAGTDAGAVFAPCPTDGTPCVVMPLGDSITEGYPNFNGGYRVELFNQAVMGSKNITFVGRKSNGPTTVD